MDDQRVSHLLAEIDKLRAEVERLRADVTIETTQTTPTSRRRALRVAGAATAAAVAGTLVNAGTAHANDPNDVVKNANNQVTATTRLYGAFDGTALHVENSWIQGNPCAIVGYAAGVGIGAVRGENPNGAGIGGVGVTGYASGGRDFLALGSGRIAMDSHFFSTQSEVYNAGEIHQTNGTLYAMVSSTVRRSIAGPNTAGALYPINPVRVYDSRSPAPNPGRLSTGQNRVVSVADARNAAGGVVTANVVPAGATAVAFNLTVAAPSAPGFLAITPGTAGSYTASIINYVASDLANASIVPLDSNRQVKIWCGAGSTHVILDIAGYYL